MRTQTVRWKIARRHLNPPRRTHRLRWTLAVVLAFLLLLSGATAAAGMYFASQLPPVTRFRIHYAFQDARIYDANGDLLFNMSDLSKNRGRRVVEPLQGRYDYQPACRGNVNRIPRVLQDATIATEDATFYKNPGFDLGSIVRAAMDDLKYGHIVSGASTITQQLVRANMLSDARTLDRKAQEVALAYEISKRFSKRKILWYYLNSVPYGNLAYGAQAAAEVYFGEPVCRLDLAQAALLAGLPRAPSIYDPVKHRDIALNRMRTVLGLLRKHGYIHAQTTIQAALTEASRWQFRPPSVGMRYPQFVRYAIDQIQRVPSLRAQLYQGVDIYTTLNPTLQDMAQRTVTSQIDGLTLQHVTDGALVSLDLRPQRYGWILAMVGSAHYSDRAGQINMAISPRQPGSSMKPFNYIWAFTNGGVGPATTVQDSPITLPDPNDTQNGGWYSPIDYDHQFHGTVTVRQALDNSLNLAAVKVEYYITGVAHVAQTAARFGMTSLYRDNPGLDCSVCYSVTLGGLSKGTRLLEETAAYGVFATGGWTVPPVAIWKVVRRSTGRVLYCSADCPRGVQPDPALAHAKQQVLDGAHAYEMTNILSDNNARCTPQVCEFGLDSPLLLSRPVAAKTGTTNEFSDNWTVGYTPQIVTGVWVGNADHSAMLDVTGITGAAPVWHDFMENAFQILRLPAVWYVRPPNVIQTNQCRVPNSSYIRYGTPDIYVGPGEPPICYIPERGSMPVPCSQYPSPGYLFRCPIQQPYFYGYGYRSQYGPYQYSSPQSPSQPVPQQGLSQPTPQQGVQPAPSLPQGVQPPLVTRPAPAPTPGSGAPNIPGVPIVPVNPGGSNGSGQ
jgi:membrane peptidoglycan carboxypeptidase